MNLKEKLSTIQNEFKSKKSRYNSFGKYNFRSAEDILEALKPYNKITCDFLSEFSKKLNLEKNINQISDLKALAFWCRKQNID